MKAGTKTVTLNLAEKMQLMEYVKAHEEDIVSGLLTKEKACIEMSPVMGKKLNPGHWRTVIEALEIRWGKRKGPKLVLAEFDKEALMVLVAAVTDLYIVEGRVMPTKLEELKATLTDALREENGGGE